MIFYKRLFVPTNITFHSNQCQSNSANFGKREEFNSDRKLCVYNA